VIKDLKDDLDSAVQEYGYFKAEVTGPDDGSDVLIGLFKRDEGRLSIANLRTVSSGETFYLLVHGVLDSPLVFETLADAIPAEYQFLLFH